MDVDYDTLLHLECVSVYCAYCVYVGVFIEWTVHAVCGWLEKNEAGGPAMLICPAQNGKRAVGFI